MRTYGETRVQAPCPICYAESGIKLYEVTSTDAAQHAMRKDLDPVRHEKLRVEIERLWRGSTCQIVRCEQCEFVHAHPYVAGREPYYSLFLSSPSYPADRFEYAQTLRALRGLFQNSGSSSSSRLLEVGAGDGVFIRRVAPAFIPKENVLCTEFSQAGVNAVRAYGINCEMTDIRGLDHQHDGRFSAICMFQVLEHLDDLDELWRTFNRLAAPRADLFFAVPNNHWIDYQERNGGELDMPPNHVGRWNGRSFATIGARHGWELAAHAIEPQGRWGVVRALGNSRFFERRHMRGSLSDRMTRISNRSLRRVCSLPFLALSCLSAIPTALSSDPATLGGTQWAHLRKTPA